MRSQVHEGAFVVKFRRVKLGPNDKSLLGGLGPALGWGEGGG